MSPTTNTNNNIILSKQSQEFNQTPNYFSKLQKLHEDNKRFLAELAYLNNNPDKAERIIHCCDYLTYEVINQQYIKLNRVNLCRERLCLNCQLAKSRDYIKRLFWTIPRLKMQQNEAIYHITLTVPNCKADKLREIIQHLISRQKAMFRAYNIKDYFRSVEITKNKKNNTYHPHLHIIAILAKNCNLPHDKNKKSVEKLRQIWHTWLNPENELDYTLATCYKLQNTRGIYEVCKYISKVKDMTNITILQDLNKTIYGLRLKTACGQFKILMQAYKAECQQLKLEEQEALENAESYLIDLIYNPNLSKYDIKRIYQKISYMKGVNND